MILGTFLLRASKQLKRQLRSGAAFFWHLRPPNHESNPERLTELLTFVIIGGGPTEVELAGALGKIANDTLKYDFRNIDPAKACILLIEAGDRILPAYPPKLSAHAEESLNRLGVIVLVNSMVTDIQPGAVTVKRSDKREIIPCRTAIWAAGVEASFLGNTLARATGVQQDRNGRVLVEPDLTIPGHPEIFVIGDLANYTHQTEKPLPGVAPVAIQQGRYVAKLIHKRLSGNPCPHSTTGIAATWRLSEEHQRGPI
jgi:NADH dehydrogenase